VLFALACGGPPAPPPAPTSASGRGGAHDPRAHLLGVSEEAFPELASLWPALSARPATEVIETFSVEEGAHCLQVLVAGDFAQEALAAWREGVRGLDCEATCRRDGLTLAIRAEGGDPPPDAAMLEALAAEMGVPEEPSATALACVEAHGASRLARIDERLHVEGLLEPWRELHERLGERRFVELRWTRSAERGTELSVRYRADEEARELAIEWAQGAGLAADEGGWRLIDEPISLAVELREGIELLLVRDDD